MAEKISKNGPSWTELGWIFSGKMGRCCYNIVI